MSQNIKKILNKYFTPTIRSRGKRYFEEGKVKNVEISKNFVSARVQGSKKYYVWIAFDNNLQHEKMSCTCPYFETDNCKHLAALFYYLNANNYFDSANNKTPVRESKDKSELESSEFSIENNTEEQLVTLPPNNKFHKNHLQTEVETFKNYFSPLINDSQKHKKKI